MAQHNSAWNQQVQVTSYGFNDAYPIIWIAFESLSLAALLVFLIWSCFTRQPRGDPKRPLPLKALIGSILIYAWWVGYFPIWWVYKEFNLQCCCSARIANIIILFLGIARATVQQSYIVLSMLNQIFYSVTAMLGFYIFWKMVQKLLERVAEKQPSKVFVPVAIVHWVLLAILSALSMAECGTYIAFIVKGINEGSGNLQLVFHYNKLSSGLSILCWVASFEILCWIVFAFVKSGDKKVISFPYSNYMRILMLI